jgi:hypothetical protein
MNIKDIRTSSDPDLAGSYAAIQRAAKSAEDLAIKTNTAIIVAVDGKPVRITAAELIKMRELESVKPTPHIQAL